VCAVTVAVALRLLFRFGEITPLFKDYNMTSSKAFDAQQYFKSRAANYDQGIRNVIPAYEALHAMSHSFLRSELPERAEILVVGAGTGMELMTIGMANPGWRFTAVEPSEEMMALCQANVAAAGLSDRVELHQGYVAQLPDKPRYDAATAILVSHFIEENDKKRALFQAISSRLRHGAPLISADLYGEKESAEFQRLFSTWKHFCSLSGQSEAELSRLFAHVESDISFIPERKRNQLLDQSGFGNTFSFYRALLFGGWVSWKLGNE
jgi:tRNA (cmo5U34)-methyltransferase